MRKKLVSHGNSSALVLDKTLMQLLHAKKGSEVEIVVQGDKLTISSADSEVRQARLATILDKVNKNHAESLKRLAG